MSEASAATPATGLARSLAKRGRDLLPALSLTEVTLAQVLLVVGPPWIGVAARFGGENVLVWLSAIGLFFVPLAATIVHASRRLPFEGGLYQWTKLAIGERAGFLVAWNSWWFAVVFLSALGVQALTAVDDVLDHPGVGLADEPLAVAVAGALLAALLTALAIRRVAAAQALPNVAAALFLLVLGLLVILAVREGTPAAAPAVMFAADLPTLALFMRIAVFSFAGLECMALMTGETERPPSDVPRSVMIAAPLIALLYVAGTASVLSFVPPAEVDLAHPLAQPLRRAGGGAAWVVAAILALLVAQIGRSSQLFNATARLPMVAAWDGFLPERFGRVDASTGTPRAAALLMGACVAVSAALGSFGVARPEAYQRTLSAAGVFLAVSYGALFLLPFANLPGKRPTPFVRVAAGLGLAMTLLFAGLSFVPASRTLFVCAIVLAVEALGVFFALRRRGPAYQ